MIIKKDYTHGESIIDISFEELLKVYNAAKYSDDKDFSKIAKDMLLKIRNSLK